MKSRNLVPSEITTPSNRPSSSLDRDDRESSVQYNVYQEVSENLEHDRVSKSDIDMKQSEKIDSVPQENNVHQKKVRLKTIAHALAEFMGVAENDSSEDEENSLDQPDSRDANQSASEANYHNGITTVNVHEHKTKRRVSNHRKVWENRRLRLAARKYGGIKETVKDLENPRVHDDEINTGLQDQIDSSYVPKFLPVNHKPTFIEYSKEGYQWLKQQCCPSRNIANDVHQEYIPKPQPQNEETSDIDEDEFFQNELSSKDLVDDGRGDTGSIAAVGLSRIPRSTLENLQDNSNRRSSHTNGGGRQYGVGLVGKLFGNKYHRGRKNRHSPTVHRTSIRESIDETEDYRPYFTYWITFVQIIITIMSLVWYGVANFGVELSKVEDFIKTEKLTLDQVVYYEPSNFWLGPRPADLIHLGAKYAPCMRQDWEIENEIRLRNIVENNSTGCCVRNDGSGCLQTTRDYCSRHLSTFYKWGGYYGPDKGPEGRTSGPVCGQDPRYCHSPASQPPYSWPDDITNWPVCREQDVEVGLGNILDSGSPPHVSCELTGRPCCVGIHGKCEIRSAEYCQFVNGHFHPEATLCSQISCMSDVCGMLSFGDGGHATDQVYRLWTSLFLHAGIVHLTVTILVQYYLMRDLEKMCGPVRICIIYLGSGILGNAASSIFVPHRAESGPAGSHFGLLAALFVECINVWPILRHPGRAIGKLLGVLLLLLVLGFLPWIDNYAHIFGFIGGILLSFAFLPYLTFSNMENSPGRVTTHCASILYTRKGRLWLIWVSIAFWITLLSVLIILFYSNAVDCEWCKYFSCIPFTNTFCADQNINLRRSEKYFF